MVAQAVSLKKSARMVLWNRSIFPVVVGEYGAVSRCRTPFSRQIRSKSTSVLVTPNRPVNTLPLSGQHGVGNPIGPHGLGQGRAHRLGRRLGHQQR
jgi:hypothetical protein